MLLGAGSMGIENGSRPQLKIRWSAERNFTMTDHDANAPDTTLDQETARRDHLYRLAQARALARATAAAGPGATETQILSRLERTPSGQIIPSEEDFDAVRDAA